MPYLPFGGLTQGPKPQAYCVQGGPTRRLMHFLWFLQSFLPPRGGGPCSPPRLDDEAVKLSSPLVAC